MKVSLNTIKQYTKVDLTVDELVHKINQQLGGVEQVIDLGAKYKDAVIVKVISAVKHDNADKLSVCLVDDGGVVNDVERDSQGHVQVVCGAPNVHGDMFAVWLPPKATVPASFGDEEPFVLETRDIRGVKSNGMLAAPDEMALGSDHAGIIEIDPEEWRPYDVAIKPGASFAKAYGLDDRVIDIENKMFTHRPDCFGQLGVAREIAGIQGQAFTSPDWYLTRPEFAKAEGLELSVRNDAGSKVQRFMAVAVRDVQIKPSPLWLQCALVALGSKPINNVVDVTNYVMLLTAQPLHAYDYDKLRGHTLGARMAHKGETITLLNDKTYELTSEDIVIVDGEGPVGLGGVMGGGESEVSSQTKNIVLEAATFDMYAIRKTSMRHGLFTDAVTRFNKGQSPLQNPVCLNLALQSVLDTAGGTQASPVADERIDISYEPKDAFVHYQQINRLLGLKLTDEDINQLLGNVEFKNVGLFGDLYDLKVPFWRTDIAWGRHKEDDTMNSVANADIAEEVGRLYGFDKLPRVLPRRSMKPAPRNPLFAAKRAISQILAGAGANEVKTYSFVHENVLKRAGQDPARAYRLGNALSPDLQYYRLSLTPSLLEHVHPNIKAGHDEFALFELGKVHQKDHVGDDGLPKEFSRVAVVYGSKTKAEGAAYYQARRLLEQLLDRYGVSDDIRYVPLDIEGTDQSTTYYAPGRAASVYVGDALIGHLGEYAPRVVKGFKLPPRCAGFELGLEPLLSAHAAAGYTPLSRFPYVSQDISLKVPTHTTFSSVFETARDAFKAVQPAETTASLSTLGIYQPEQGQTKTITLRLKVASYERTLTDEEVGKYLDMIATATGEKTGAERV